MIHLHSYAVSGWVTAALVLLCSLASVSQADVRFTEPLAGANLTAGQIDVRWEDSGISPPISELTQYTLSLMVGGNDNADMVCLMSSQLATRRLELTYLSSNQYQPSNRKVHSRLETLPKELFQRALLPMCRMACKFTTSSSPAYRTCADHPCHSFFRMTSTRQEGGVLINYSDRFSIAGLSGDTALNIKQAAMALDGNTDGPPAVGNSALPSSSTMSSTSAPTSTTTTASTTSTEDVPVILVTSTSSPENTDSDSTGDADSDADDDSAGISKGAMAGIAAAVTVATIATGAALAWWYMVRRRRKNLNKVQEIAPGSFTPDSHTPMNELSAENLLSSPRRAWTHQTELSSDSMVYEAGSGERPPELDHMAFRAELEGDTPVTTPMEPGMDVMAFRAELKGGQQPLTTVYPLEKV
jgi:hypothetical protein